MKTRQKRRVQLTKQMYLPLFNVPYCHSCRYRAICEKTLRSSQPGCRPHPCERTVTNIETIYTGIHQLHLMLQNETVINLTRTPKVHTHCRLRWSASRLCTRIKYIIITIFTTLSAFLRWRRRQYLTPWKLIRKRNHVPQAEQLFYTFHYMPTPRFGAPLVSCEINRSYSYRHYVAYFFFKVGGVE